MEDFEATPGDSERIEQMAAHIRALIELMGDDPTREGLVKTPVRAAKALLYATRGYRQNGGEVMRQAIFEYAGSQMVVVKDIEFYSMCEHHILPFFGRVSIGYLPDGKMIGLSKLARLVDTFAHRLQVQERLTGEVCHALMRELQPKGVIVVCEAGHLCMKMRGVEKQDSVTTTIDYCGAFATDVALREEFMRML